MNEDADVIELPPPPPNPSLFPLSPLCFVYCWHFPSSEPGFNAVVALSLVLRNRAAVVLRCILHLLFPRQDGHCGKTAAQKADLHFGILERLPSLCAEPASPKEGVIRTVRPFVEVG